MSGYLRRHNIRIFDYPRFAEPLQGRDPRQRREGRYRDQAADQFIRKRNFRKEKRIRDIVKLCGVSHESQ